MEWKDKRGEVVRAIREKRLDDAETLFGELREIAREITDPRVEADERFTEGLLRDAQGRHEEAEGAFTAALELDRKLKGERHPAVGESLHSLAIVRSRRGDHEGAVERYRASLAIFRESRAGHVPNVLGSIGYELLTLERLDDALEAFEEAERVARTDAKIPLHDLARALVGAGEALRREKRWVASFSKFATCTQLATSAMWPRLAREVAGAWLGLGVVSRYALANAQVQAAHAFWFASIVGEGEAKQKAVAQLEMMTDATSSIGGDPARLRVVYADGAGNVHVASSTAGLRHVRTERQLAVAEILADDDAIVRAMKPKSSTSTSP